MILAFGDSHRNKAALDLIAAIIVREAPGFFVHTGDNFADFQWLKTKTRKKGWGVRGNCDLGLISGARDEIIIEYPDMRILLTHGHQYGVKYSYQMLTERAKELKTDAVIFGHSHVQFIQEQEGIWLINPGSIPLPRGGSRPGYARIHLVNGKLAAELVKL